MADVRSFSTFFSKPQLQSYQQGVMRYTYKGIPCLKSPIDVAIYLKLIHHVAPKTIIEIGSKSGGSALLFRDFAQIMGVGASIVSIDINPPPIVLDGVTFLQGSVLDLDSVFGRNGIYSMPRPWLVIEDSAHTLAGCCAALYFFSQHLVADEWLVMEDGILEELGISERYDGGPNRAIRKFFMEQPGLFEIATDFCDMFGSNATYNPNGYLRRTELKFPTP